MAWAGWGLPDATAWAGRLRWRDGSYSLCPSGQSGFLRALSRLTERSLASLF